MNFKSFQQKPVVWLSIILCLVPFVIYFQVINHEFISFDDADYVYGNYVVKRGLSIQGFMSAFKFGSSDLGKVTYWHPLTWLSHMLDIEVFGLNPGPHHLVNLFLHILNTLLLFTILRMMTGAIWQSAMVAALFALHPLNVDTVAWIAERKNLLSSFFWMITTLLYFFYVKTLNRGYYIFSIITFILGILAKPMLVSLPFVFLLLDYWPLQRLNIIPTGSQLNMQKVSIKKALTEKIPFFVLSILIILISTISLQKAGISIPFSVIPPLQRITNAFISYVLYVIKTIIPINLTYFYPYPEKLLPAWQILLSIIFLSAMTALCAYQYKKRPYLIVGWLWFGITLFPVSGLLQGGVWPLIAERWAYITVPGIFIMFTWGISEFSTINNIYKKVVIVGAISVLILLGILTWRQAGYWENNLTLYSHALRITPDDYISHMNLGVEYNKNNEIDKAIYHFRESLKIKPKHPYSLLGLGISYLQQNKYEEAIKQFKSAVTLKPDFAVGYFNFGLALCLTGDKEKAIDLFKKAVSLDQNIYDYYKYLGIMLLEQGNTDEAIQALNRAVQLSPDENAELYYYLGSAYSMQQEFDDAIKYLKKSLSNKSTYAEARAELGTIYLKLKFYDDAINQLLLANRLDTDFADNYAFLGIAYFYKGMFDESVLNYKKAIELKPDFAEAYNNLGSVLLSQGKVDDSIVQFQKAVEIKPYYADAKNNLATALNMKRTKTYDKASLRNVLSVDSLDPYELIKKGYAYQTKEDYERAMEYYNKAISLKADLPSARNNLGVVKMRIGKYDEAYVLFTGIIKEKPDNIEGYYNLACLYSIQNKPEESVKWLSKAIDKGFNNRTLLNDDPDLNNIRSSSMYKDLLKNFRN